MRTRVWNNMANIRFKAFYCGRCSSLSGSSGRLLSFFLSFASAGSVAAWAIWKEHPIVWATTIGLAQVLHVAKPYIPFIGAEKELQSMAFEFEKLYLHYEQLWFGIDNNQMSAAKAEMIFYQYREKEIEIEKNSKVNCPEFKHLIQKAQEDTEKALARNFPA
jgi:hypothetical protein